jgi:cell wall-associated NlpC family hydrolase
MRGTALIVAVVIGMMTIIGCAPSVRYTRTSDGQVAYVVPRNWDYRQSYKIPATKLESVIKTYIGIPYRFAGMSRKGLDCSGLVCLVFYDVSKAKLPHSSRKMHQLGRPVSLSTARPGDLVFFKGSFLGMINHVGIYLGDNRFVHASSSKGVIYSNLNDEYYKKRFADIRRIF